MTQDKDFHGFLSSAKISSNDQYDKSKKSLKKPIVLKENERPESTLSNPPPRIDSSLSSGNMSGKKEFNKTNKNFFGSKSYIK